MENEPKTTEPSKEEEKAFHEKVRSGTVIHKEGLGYFIVPDGDPNGIVDLPDVGYNELPAGYNVGDRVKFKLDQFRAGVDLEKIAEEVK